MQVLIIDNYDSFTYNLFHYVQQITPAVEVHRNDEISIEEMDRFSHIVISPGPGLPVQAGVTLPLLERYHAEKSILGVCLGCQAMAEWSGGKLYNQQWVAHGVARPLLRLSNDDLLLNDLPRQFPVGLYHSWAVERESLPAEWRITAESEAGVLMAMEHRRHRLYGVQFHPESIMTEGGQKIIANWLQD